MSTAAVCQACTGPLDESGVCQICEHFARLRQARRVAATRERMRVRQYRPPVPRAADGKPVNANNSALPPSDR